MPTLRELEAQGIDVTRMSSEALREIGYVTPMNELPVVIDAPGIYLTRNGRRVTIHAVAPRTELAVSAFAAKGSIWKKPDSLGINPEYGIWHDSGAYRALGEHGLDIVAKAV